MTDEPATRSGPPANPLPVEAWFGPRFAELHPLLQALHVDGGTLAGDATVRVGTGAGGWVGRHMLRRLGVSTGTNALRVHIRNDRAGLHWSRSLGGGAVVESLFVPVGTIADGWWIERSGPVEMRLAVDIVDRGWFWRPLDLRWRGVPVPRWLQPRVRAGKRIDGDDYVFAVAIALPLLGEVLTYQGRLRRES